MKSIQTKILLLVLSTILLTAIIIGGVGFFTAKRILRDNSQQVMNLMCSERAMELDRTFSYIEQSVQGLAEYAREELTDIERLKTDDAYVEEYTQNLQKLSVTMAKNTIGAIAVYIRYNPEFTPPTAGVFWSRTEDGGEFTKLAPTDLSKYDPTDAEHVGWYYIPMEKKAAVWMPPYFNKNINIEMISYVIPIYKDGEAIGVVGMDIDYSVIIESVKEIRVYESGYAYLTNQNDEIMYHHLYPQGTKTEDMEISPYAVFLQSDDDRSGKTKSLNQWTFHDAEELIVFRNLENGMKLFLSAPAAEINEEGNRLIFHTFMLIFLIFILFLWVPIIISQHIIKPLKELNLASQKIASGDLSVNLKPGARDEIGTLAESFQIMVCRLREYRSRMKDLAYQDVLTGTQNKTAYQDYVNHLETDISKGAALFGIIVFDVNNLKVVNDKYGHDCGDRLLENVGRIIVLSFRKSKVFRIGGDEFVVIAEGADYEQYQTILRDFQEKLKAYNLHSPEAEQCSIAYGVSIYDKETDANFLSVFQRADKEMYANKAEIKAGKDGLS